MNSEIQNFNFAFPGIKRSTLEIESNALPQDYCVLENTAQRKIEMNAANDNENGQNEIQ